MVDRGLGDGYVGVRRGQFGLRRMAGEFGILVAGGLRLRFRLGDGGLGFEHLPRGQRDLGVGGGDLGDRRRDRRGGRPGAQLCQRGCRFRHVGRGAFHLGRGDVAV